MIEVKNQFVRHSLFWFWVLPFAMVLLIPAFFSREDMRVPREEVMMISLLGEDVEKITRRADDVFDTLFVHTGLKKMSSSLFTSSVKDDEPRFFRNLAAENNKYNENVWNMVYRAIWRLSGLWPVFTSLMFGVALPALIDGLVVRAKKLDVFEAHNPVFFWSAGHSLVMIFGLFVILPLLPYTITINLLYGAIVTISFALWITASNFQTGV